MLEELKQFIAINFKNKKQPAKPTKRKIERVIDDSVNINLGKDLLWEKFPHYPQMGTAYRKFFQKYEIDYQTKIKIYDALCGTDLCNVASGNGPYVDYACTDEASKDVDRNVTRLDLTKKASRLLPDKNLKNQLKFFAHVFSFDAAIGEDYKLDWQSLKYSTLSGGYLFITQKVNRKEFTKSLQTAKKIAKQNGFSFVKTEDHTKTWIEVLEVKINKVLDSQPEYFANKRAAIIFAFRDEALHWARILRDLKNKKLKIVTTIYRH
jgi:hypothetical protein